MGKFRKNRAKRNGMEFFDPYKIKYMKYYPPAKGDFFNVSYLRNVLPITCILLYYIIINKIGRFDICSIEISEKQD